MERKPEGVSSPLKGKHAPQEGKHQDAAQRLEDLIENARTKHEAHVGTSVDQKASNQSQEKSLLTSWLPCISTKAIDDDFARMKMGNYVALRGGSGKERFFEEMPLYVRVGMHLLFYGSQNASLLRYASVEHLLETMSKRQGATYDDASKPEEVQEFIKHFIATYELKLDDLAEQDLTKYPTRNSFFYRKLKPDARPIAEPENDRIVSSSADCRLMVFDNVETATKVWIKGKHFTLGSLLGGHEDLFPSGSSLAIFRLAPADYHRFHHPIGPNVQASEKVPLGKEYYTVNPDAVTDQFDVFTGNVRQAVLLDWKAINAKVGFVAIGAMLVASINWTDTDKTSATTTLRKRGEEFGYFAYGGSTCIAVFPPDAKVKWDDDIKSNSLSGLETFVRVGERIGESKAEAATAPATAAATTGV